MKNIVHVTKTISFTNQSKINYPDFKLINLFIYIIIYEVLREFNLFNCFFNFILSSFQHYIKYILFLFYFIFAPLLLKFTFKKLILKLKFRIL
jgi:hypothetical protein